MAKINVKTAPQAEPLDKEDVKLHLRIDVPDHDDALDRLIIGARKKVERISNRRLITQTLEIYMDDWPSGRTIDLPIAPVQSITNVSYYDSNDTLQVLSNSKYVADIVSEPGRIVLIDSEVWPDLKIGRPNRIVIELVAGYGDAASDVDENIKTAMLMGIEIEFYRPDSTYMAALDRVIKNSMSPYYLKRF